VDGKGKGEEGRMTESRWGRAEGRREVAARQGSGEKERLRQRWC
jgi:hypothetical protein